MSILIKGVEMPKGTNMMLLITPDGDVWEMGDLIGDDKLIDGAKAIPAADVRPVITCGECKHWETDWTPRSVSDGRHYCAPLDLFPSADWYCSDGEKREES